MRAIPVGRSQPCSTFLGCNSRKLAPSALPLQQFSKCSVFQLTCLKPNQEIHCWPHVGTKGRAPLDILEKGEITSKEAERLRGRMLFFESFVFGRIANLCLKQFGDLCRTGRTTSKLAPAELVVVRNLYARVETAISVPMGILNLPAWIIFTDGACEGDVAVGSVGGVLIAPNHRVVHHFSAVAPEWVMKVLLRTQSMSWK